MSDKIMAIVALATMITFPDIDLIIVISFVSLLAAYDFWQSFRSKKNGGQKP